MYFQRKLIVCMEEGYVFLFVVTTSSLFDNGHQQQTQTTGCYWFLQRQQKVLFGGQETSINPWKPVRTIVQTWQDKWDSNETASCSLSFCLQTGTDWLHLAHCCTLMQDWLKSPFSKKLSKCKNEISLPLNAWHIFGTHKTSLIFKYL